MFISEEDYNKFKYLNPNKKIVVLYGNCHTTAIRQLLNTNSMFRLKYAIFPIKAIQEVKDPEYFKSKVFSECDLFIHQSIQKSNRYGNQFSSESVMSQLKDNAIVLSIPNVYHLPLCYFPQYIEGNEFKNRVGQTMFFRDSIIDECLKNGMPVKEIVDCYDDLGRFSQGDILDSYNLFIKKVQARENEWDVKIAHFLNKRKNEYLFYDPNHPTVIVIKYICEEILKQLKICDLSLDLSQMKSLDDYEMPICKDVIKCFKMEDNEDREIRITGNKVLQGKMDTERYIRQYCSLVWQDKSFDNCVRIKSYIMYSLYRYKNIAYKLRNASHLSK